MWRAVGCSVVGTSHEKLQTPCQDFSDYYSCILGGERVFLIAIADGAGSASASEIGSFEAVQCVLRIIAHSDYKIREITDGVVAGWLYDVRKHLETVADERRLPTREIACTLLFAILGESNAIFAQIGDGAWIAGVGTTYFAPTWPVKGEYANQTTFITSPNWREALQFAQITSPIDFVAGFSDGLENVALHDASHSVHAPFFEVKFNALQTIEDETSLRAPLMEYLSSKALVEHTDDDKTLVLAAHRKMKMLGFSEEAEKTIQSSSTEATESAAP